MSRVAVITGASSGIGEAAAEALAQRGWRIAVVGRNPERTAEVAGRVGGDRFVADFDRLDDVRALAADLLARYDRIDALANNAGGLVRTRQRTVDGFERSIQQNHLAPFLLTNLLLPVLEASDARVITTASSASRWGPVLIDDLGRDRRPWLGGWTAYGMVKLANILFATELARRSSVWSAAFHPGFVATSWGKDTLPLRLYRAIGTDRVGRTPQEGARPLIELADSPEPLAPSGTFFDYLRPGGRTHRQASDPEAAGRLWDRSAQLLGLVSSR